MSNIDMKRLIEKCSIDGAWAEEDFRIPLETDSKNIRNKEKRRLAERKLKNIKNDIYEDGYFNGYNAAINEAIHKFKIICDNIKSIRSDSECFLTEKNIVDILEDMIKL